MSWFLSSKLSSLSLEVDSCWQAPVPALSSFHASVMEEDMQCKKDETTSTTKEKTQNTKQTTKTHLSDAREAQARKPLTCSSLEAPNSFCIVTVHCSTTILI